MQNYNIIGLVLLSSITAAIPIHLIKLYVQTKNIKWIILSILCYIILIILYYFIIARGKNIIIIYPIIKILSIFFVIFIGFILFNTKLDMKSYIGILLGIISIYLLSN